MNRTKSAIVDVFWELLEEKPYSKITVKDIVNSCQINRNTFYYHFHDIPDLLEYMIKEDADYIIQNYSNLENGSLMDCLIPIIQYATRRRKAVLHIYHSVQRETFLEHLERITLYVVTQYIDAVISDKPIRAEDKALMIRFYKCVLVGITLDWLSARMGYDIIGSFVRLTELLPDSNLLFRHSLPMQDDPTDRA